MFFNRKSRSERKKEAQELDSKLEEMRKQVELEKNDVLAIIIAAFTTLLPFLLIIIAVFLLLTSLFFPIFG